MAIQTLDQLVSALPGQHEHFTKSSTTAEGAGTWHSLWMVAGQPGAAATPSANTVPTSATAGSFTFTNPTGGALSYLGKMAAAGSVAGTLILYDRLWHTSGLSGIVTTVDTAVANSALTRPDANGADVELWGEIYTAIGATAATLNVKYTDQDGTTAQVGTYAHPANAESVGQMFPIQLAAGDTGVRAVTNYHWSVSTGTAGNFGFTLLRRIAEIPLAATNVAVVLDGFALGLPRIYDSACLALMLMCTTTTTGALMGSIDIVQG